MFQRNVIHDSSTISGYAEKRCKVTDFFRTGKAFHRLSLPLSCPLSPCESGQNRNVYFLASSFAISFFAFAICFWKASEE
ncbi:Uncharacterised protein [Prevotella denticola]|uniref:Uncharacterized protein n=1 Tax=Prevotella denticola TaxID=28129 RepID=A0A379EBP7_9BACT|nr:Uncharacterised protein [Prevotella denticola]